MDYPFNIQSPRGHKMSDEKIDIGETPNENFKPEMDEEKIKFDSAAETDSSDKSEESVKKKKSSANGFNNTKNSRRLSVDNETADKIFDLLQLAHDATNWGYKGLTNREEREAGSRSVSATKNVFAHAYAVDPEKAIKKWTEVNGHPPSNDWIHAAQTLPLLSPKKALDSLTVNVEKASSQVSKITAQKRENEIRTRISSLRGPQGDAIARKKEYAAAVIDTFIPEKLDQSDNGLFLFRALVEANKNRQKVKQAMLLGGHGRQMSKEMKDLTKDLRSIELGKILITSNKIPGLKQTVGIMGIDITKKIKIPEIALAAKLAMSRPGHSNGVNINEATMAAYAMQSGGLGVNI